MLISVRQTTVNYQTLANEIREKAFETVRHIYRPLDDRSRDPIGNIGGDRIDVIASVEGQSVGVIGLYSEENVLRIVGLAVLNEFRRQGIARQLVCYADRVARKRGATSLGLYTIAETGNVQLFHRLGFIVLHERIAKWCSSTLFEVVHEVEMKRVVRANDEFSNEQGGPGTA